MTYAIDELAADTVTGHEPRHEQLELLMARFHDWLDENRAAFLFDVRASGLHSEDKIAEMGAFHDGKRPEWCLAFYRDACAFLDARSPH